MGNDKKLFIGLDVGSNSVGWAATDDEYNLLRLKGKTAWGARLFDDAKSAKERRMYRTAGRRLARRKRRIDLLNALFAPLLQQKDENFLLRLEYSRLFDEDKPEKSRFKTLLFNDKALEKAFSKKYPTIWHLRQAMLDGKDEAFSDIRFFYLAVHHIVKYRGNFLRAGTIDTGSFDESIFESVNGFLASIGDRPDGEDEAVGDDPKALLPNESFQKFMSIALDKSLPKIKKKSELVKLFQDKDDSTKPFVEMFCALCCGSAFNSKKLSDSSEYGEVQI